MRLSRHFSNNLDRHDNKLISLYDEGILWSFFGIIMKTDLIHLLGSTQVLGFNYHFCRYLVPSWSLFINNFH